MCSGLAPDLLVDVGAHLGEFGTRCRSLYRGRIIAFDPALDPRGGLAQRAGGDLSGRSCRSRSGISPERLISMSLHSKCSVRFYLRARPESRSMSASSEPDRCVYESCHCKRSTRVRRTISRSSPGCVGAASRRSISIQVQCMTLCSPRWIAFCGEPPERLREPASHARDELAQLFRPRKRLEVHVVAAEVTGHDPCVLVEQ
jgi:hypothetical protein